MPVDGRQSIECSRKNFSASLNACRKTALLGLNQTSGLAGDYDKKNMIQFKIIFYIIVEKFKNM